MERNDKDVIIREFLPSAISLERESASPAGRSLIWLIIFIFSSSVAWASLSQIDIVAVAPGKIIPDGRTKSVQTSVKARVKNVMVKDGDLVSAGQLLLELDDEQLKAEIKQVEQRHQQADEEVTRYEALLELIRGKQKNSSLDLMAKSVWRLYLEEKEQINKQITAQNIELKKIKITVDKFNATLPIIRKKEQRLEHLAKNNLSSKQQHLDQKQIRLEVEHELARNEIVLEEILNNIDSLKQSLLIHQAETENTFLDKLEQARFMRASSAQELERFDQLKKQYSIFSEVSGRVHQLMLNSTNNVVTPAQQVMLIVPEDRSLKVEAFIKNSDVGFVRQGQTTHVKVDAYPFTKYGLLKGEIEHISSDALEDKLYGYVYKMQVKLDKELLEYQGKNMPLSPGMNVTSEVITGKRRLIDYFLSPLKRFGDESIRER